MRRLVAGLVLLALGCSTPIVPDSTAVAKLALRPEAATWPTYLYTPADLLRLAAPQYPLGPGLVAELQQLRDWAKRRTPEDLQAIAYWNDLAPAIRWAELAAEKVAASGWAAPRAARALALVQVAIHDATVISWAARADHPRPAPGRVDPGVQALVAPGDEPSWPSEHAAAGWAAAEVLSALFPDHAFRLRLHAYGAAESRVAMGANFPSDISDGKNIGLSVAARVLARAAADGSDALVALPLPTTGDQWTSNAPAEALAGTWKPWLPAPTPPPPLVPTTDVAAARAAFDAATPAQREAAAREGAVPPPLRWHDRARALAAEAKLDAPTAARLMARLDIAQADAMIAVWRLKYQARLKRPSELAGGPTPAQTPPPHPAWPSDQAAAAEAARVILADAFPAQAAALAAEAREAADAGLRAGWQYPADVRDGEPQGAGVASDALRTR